MVRCELSLIVGGQADDRADCVGRSVAWLTLWLSVTSLVLRYDMAFAEGFDRAAFLDNIRDYFVVSHDELPLVMQRWSGSA